MKQYAYELYKVLWRRTAVLALAGMLCASLALFAVQSWRTDAGFFERRDEIAALEVKYADIDPDAAYAELETLSEELAVLGRLSLYAQLSEENEFFGEMYDELLAESGGVLEKYADSPLLTDRVARDGLSYAVHIVTGELAHITGYRSFIEDMQTRADTMLKPSIFEKKGSFSNNNIQKTPKDFAPLASLPLKLGYERGVVAVSSFRTGDLLVPVEIFIFCVYLFLHEYDTGLIRLVRTTPRGRGRTAAAKLAALVTLTALIWAFLYAAPFATLLVKYRLSFVSDTRNTEAFRNSSRGLPIGVFIALASLLQLITAFAVSVWTLWLSRRTRKASFGILFAASLFGLPFLLSAAGVDILAALSPVAAFTPYQAVVTLGARSFVYIAGVLAALGGGVALLYRERSAL
ncbi:MAG: ABC transporter permease [Clostridiaceae bacterium]|nr:ABC transporter permease [Clostridiaceae bacterium]